MFSSDGRVLLGRCKQGAWVTALQQTSSSAQQQQHGKRKRRRRRENVKRHGLSLAGPSCLLIGKADGEEQRERPDLWPESGLYRAKIEALFVFQPPGLMDSITQRTSPTYHGGQTGGRDKLRTSSGDSCRDRAGPGDRDRIRNQLIQLGKR